MQGDLTVPANVEKLFDAAIDAFGGVDIAINTVGKVMRKPFVETTEAEYDSMFAAYTDGYSTYAGSESPV